jgi:hypothetical protein
MKGNWEIPKAIYHGHLIFLTITYIIPEKIKRYFRTNFGSIPIKQAG